MLNKKVLIAFMILIVLVICPVFSVPLPACYYGGYDQFPYQIYNSTKQVKAGSQADRDAYCFSVMGGSSGTQVKTYVWNNVTCGLTGGVNSLYEYDNWETLYYAAPAFQFVHYRCSDGNNYGGFVAIYETNAPDEELNCDFSIEPYPAQPGQVLTLTDLTTGGTPTAYDWMVKNPMGIWDNSTMGDEQNATYLLGYGGYYTFSHVVSNGGGTWECSYDYFGGTNYTSIFNVTPTIIGNFSVNLTKNITGTFEDMNLTVIDKDSFANQIHNMTYFGNYSHAWTDFCDNMTGVVNLTFNEVEDRINPFLYLTDLLLQGHNMYVALMIPLLVYTSFPLLITSAVVNIIPVPIQMLISFGLLIDFVFLVLRGPD